MAVGIGRSCSKDEGELVPGSAVRDDREDEDEHEEGGDARHVGEPHGMRVVAQSEIEGQASRARK